MYSAQAINDRLKNFSKDKNGFGPEKARVILALERIVARLMTDSFLREKLIFGGGFVLYKINDSNRFTRDVDAIISGVERSELIQRVSACLGLDIGDGFWFGNLIIEDLKIENGYGGIRFKVQVKAGLPRPTAAETKRLIRVHLDISLGIEREEYAENKNLSSLMNLYENVSWKIYPVEFICAEKIHSIFSKGDLNTRGKDVYDLGILLDSTDKEKLREAVNKTFQSRGDSTENILSVISSLDTSTLEESFKKSQFFDSSINFAVFWDKLISALHA